MIIKSQKKIMNGSRGCARHGWVTPCSLGWWIIPLPPTMGQPGMTKKGVNLNKTKTSTKNDQQGRKKANRNVDLFTWHD